MTGVPLIEVARRWVSDNYPYNRAHLLNALWWIDLLAPDASEALRIATVTHDMERAFPGPDSPAHTSLVDAEYEQAHANRSARIVGEWLRAQDADAGLTAEVERLIQAHEIGGWPEADLLQAADSLSFLDVNVDLFLGFAASGRFPLDDIRRKFHYSRDRIRIPHLKDMATPMLERALARLDEVERTKGPTSP